MMRDGATFEPVESRVTKPEFWSALPARWMSDEEETLVCSTFERPAKAISIGPIGGRLSSALAAQMKSAIRWNPNIE